MISPGRRAPRRIPTHQATAPNCSRWFDWWSLSWKTRRGIIETDIGFNVKMSWNTGAFDHRTTGSPYSFESVALHELGHALGLNHEDRSMATMNSFYPNSGPVGQWKEWDPLADDRQGVRFLYPDGATEIDLVSSVFRRTGAGSSGLVSSPTLAAPGSSVDVQFTFGNLGTRRETFDIGFYLSPDDRIDSFDIRLGTNFGAWADPGVTATHSRRLTIPSRIAPGTYWLGVIVDDADAVAEEVEDNNGVAMPWPTAVGRGAVAFDR